MKIMKWIWIALGTVLAASIALFFFWPTIQWYSLIPEREREAALASRLEQKAYVQAQAATDMALLLGDPSRPIPNQFRYLVSEASRHLQKVTGKPASRWTVGDLAGEFSDRDQLALAIKGHYRDELSRIKRRSSLVVGITRFEKSGVTLTVLADLTSVSTADRQKVLDNVRQVLLARASLISSGSPSFHRIGQNQFVLTIPGAHDVDQARAIVETRGRLVFRLVDERGLSLVKAYVDTGKPVVDESGTFFNPAGIPNFPHGSSLLGVYGADEWGLEKLKGYTVLRDEIALDGTAIRDAQVAWDSYTKGPVVNFLLSAEGGNAFYMLTSSNIGRVLAVVLDDHVKAQATIQEPIRDQVRVSGFTQAESRDLVLVLKSGSLPVRLRVISTSTGSP